jgi:PilZ domain-containing protein
MATLAKPVRARARGRQVERRRLPRIPLAIPVRYATESGDVGIGVMTDITLEGAGLIVPHINREAFHVWIQFLWFDDNMGLQGRVAFLRETPDGIHVGVHLQLVSARSQDFISNLLIPYGLKKFRADRGRLRSLGHALLAPSGTLRRQLPQRALPVLIAQGSILEWAITEYRDEARAVMLTPRLPREDLPLILTSWGRSGVYRATVLEASPLAFGAVTLYRVMVRYSRAAGHGASGRRGATARTTGSSNAHHPASA